MKPKILVIYNKNYESFWSFDLNWGWIEDLKEDGYEILKWGIGYNNMQKAPTQNDYIDVINSFKPDYIYCSIKSVYDDWMPHLPVNTAIKILVECDTQEYKRTDPFALKFDKVYCRQPRWGEECREIIEGLDYETFAKKWRNADTWKETQLLRWSVSLKRIKYHVQKKPGVFFNGRLNSPYYDYRRRFYANFKDIVNFGNDLSTAYQNIEDYYNYLYAAEAFVCPAESNIGSLVPGKIFEAAAAGCAIITNCDLIDYNMADLNEVVCRYRNETELREIILSESYKPFVNKAQDIIKYHTHIIRYKEIFG